MTSILASFGKPFDFQVAAFRLRLGNLIPTKAWDDIAGAEHDRGFMVAGAMRADILADIGAAIDKAITQGTTLEEFRRDFRKIVAAKGWQISTAGQGTKGGEAWRTRVIYRTNMATSYAAGRMAQLVKAGFPYWVYKHGASMEPRVQHLAWDGLVLPPGHPFWASHAPPNGWGCSCYIVGARSPNAAKRLGGKPEMALPDGWQSIDKKTGVQVGIDKGWDHAPGATVADTVSALAHRAVNWDYSLAVAFMKSVPAANRDLLSEAYRSQPGFVEMIKRFVSAVRNTPTQKSKTLPDLKTLGLAPDRQRQEIFRAVGQADGPDLYDFVIDQSAIRHVLDRHTNEKIEQSRGQRAITDADFGRLGELLNAPDLIERGDPMVGHPATVRLEKTIGAEKLVAIFEVRPGRRRIALVTMWVEVIAGAPPTMTP